MCYSSVLQDIRIMNSFLECQNSCPTECSSSEFRTVQSTALLNTKHLVDDANEYCKHDNKSTSICQEMTNMSDAQKIQYFRENLVSINVYLKDFYFEEVRQVPVFGWSELVSGVGGNFGLFLGMSILTIMEFFEFQLRQVYYYATLAWKR
ncbi:FMRFamide-activated amiloride-sensitive sodium channel-like [Exaiptasia diaphana]|uniref:Uncharacterized protein n=1 Tax=Exaiptasia diaphana TaxID=2652724 RepID=A0A913YIR3_EXADI|nr:FMRFamide-activated amiloride-sensitive sodium channel-like [Exaiptasia diaphana]